MSVGLTLQGSELRMESHTKSQFAGRRVHFIGIGGSGMAGLAGMLLDVGAQISGSDLQLSPQLADLERRGARVSTSQRGDLLTRAIDLVVRTAAVADDNAEFQKVQQLGLPHTKYARLLGQVMAERFGVAVAGTHGKSTTTSMLAFALQECGVDPSFVIGAAVRQLGGSSRAGRGRVFVAEACEYDRSFHNLHPRVAIITNIEADHLDCYPGGISEIVQSFADFARAVPPQGMVIANGADANVRAALADIPAQVQWSQPPALCDSGADYTWTFHVQGATRGCYQAKVCRKGRPVTDLQLRVAGLHNLANAVQALAACCACGLEATQAADALGRFEGVDRRMTEVGQFAGATVVDDYAHHPTEIRTTLRALHQRYSPKRLVCVFQPHQGSRTRLLMDEFEGAFEQADQTIIPDIYYVRDSEEERQRIRASDLVQRLQQRGQRAQYLPTFEQILDHLRHQTHEGDLIVTMGAGNIGSLGRQLVTTGHS